MKTGKYIAQALAGVSLMFIVILIGRAFQPEDLLRVGDGFTSYKPGLLYPIGVSFLSTILYFLITIKLTVLKSRFYLYLGLLVANMLFLFFCFYKYSG